MILPALLLAVTSTCVPINSDMLWAVLPSGQSDFFLRNGDTETFAGPEPWYAVVRPGRRMINIATRPSYRGTPREYGFVDGQLRFASEGDEERAVAVPPPPKPTGSAIGFWPNAATVAELRVKNDMWRGGGRLRFISMNPNRTALFLAQLGLVALGFALFAAGIWRLHGLLWCVLLLQLQFMSLSRGGILAFLLGSAVMLGFWLRRRRHLKQLVLAGLGGLLLLGASAYALRNRLTQETSESGGQSRTAIWREVPRMVAAAPWGWGLWKSGAAYNAWFEKPERRHMVGDLFNDHLSRFVEGGFLWGGLYVFVWCLVLTAFWRWSLGGGSPVFLAVSVAYFVASSFNPMNYWAKSFIVPGALTAVWLVRVLVGRAGAAFRTRREAKAILLWTCGLASVVLAGAGVAAALAPAQDVPLRVSPLGRRVIAGEGEPDVWVVDDGFVLDGNFNGYPGREIRERWKRHPTSEPLGIVTRVGDLPSEVDRLVLAGTSGRDYLAMRNPPKARHIVFLSPPFPSTAIPEALRKTCDVHLVTGHFVAVRTGDAQRSDSWVHIVPGAQVYVPGWLDIVLKDRKHDS